MDPLTLAPLFSSPTIFSRTLTPTPFLPAHSYMTPCCLEIRPGQLLPWPLFRCPEIFSPGYFLDSLPYLCSFKSLLKCLLLIQIHSNRLLMLQPAPPGPFLLPNSATTYIVLFFFFFLIIYFYLKNSNLKKSCKYSVNNFFLESFERKFLTKYHIISDTLVGISYKQGHFPT